MTDDVIRFTNENLVDSVGAFGKYRKCSGLIMAYMCHLPVVTNGFILTKTIPDDTVIKLDAELGHTILCRVDTPFNHWANIPRGKDIEVSDLNAFFNNLRSSCSDTIFLCFQHPSIFFTGKFIERWNISGGFNVLIVWGKKIVIECVGRGFDVGDLTRGTIKSHNTIEIRWGVRNNKINDIWESAHIQTIALNEYINTRKKRIETLLEMGYENETLEKSIPMENSTIIFETFENLYKECILKVIKNQELFSNETPIIIQINSYGEKIFHVFEIWRANI